MSASSQQPIHHDPQKPWIQTRGSDSQRNENGLQTVHSPSRLDLSFPRLHHAPVQHAFRRLEDLICWTRPVFRADDFDCMKPSREFQSTLRSIWVGGLNLSRTEYSTDIRINASVEDQVLFTFNAEGKVHFNVKGLKLSPPRSAGITVVTSTEGQYIRGKGSGLLLTSRPSLLLQSAQAMHGPMAVRLLRQRLNQPIGFHGYATGTSTSMPLSLLQSLRLVDSLISPNGTLPTALALDDLISRQLVLMLCPELQAEDPAEQVQPPAASFGLLLEWICSRLDQPLSLTDLERQSGYSRRALQRAFHNRFGCSPMQWLRRRRLEQALQHLTEADHNRSVSHVARQCGYISLSSFSRDFQVFYGRSPSDVLRANRR